MPNGKFNAEIRAIPSRLVQPLVVFMDRPHRAYLPGYRRAKGRYRADLREMEDRFDDRLSELQDEYASRQCAPCAHTTLTVCAWRQAPWESETSSAKYSSFGVKRRRRQGRLRPLCSRERR